MKQERRSQIIGEEENMKREENMKKASLIMAVAVCLMGVMGQVQAADTGTISVTVSLLSEISVSVAPTTWTIGPVALSGSSGPAPFTASVGNTTCKLEIKGDDGAGLWTIGATAGADRFVVSVSDPAITLTKTNQELAASVAAYGNKAFSLTYSAPTSDTKGGGVAQGFAVTIKASAP
ncbi:MAG: hypothetical protein NTU83_04715 [Candidatus Hydrogenedentes bacterium]|nr:hypothetical protein [Candidatus Hydrogenedentota bacterium]